MTGSENGGRSARLYEMSREELEYVLSTFETLAQHQQRTYGNTAPSA